MIRTALLIAALLANSAAAETDSSKRPVLRPVAGTQVEQSGTIRPPARNEAAAEETKRRGFLGLSLRPLLRSGKTEREGRKARRLRKKGAVCNDIDIQGVVVGRVPGRIRGCGVENAVRVRSVSGVGLSQESVMDCTTARSLKAWIDGSARPALKRKGGGLSRIKVAAHYACRTRNNRKGAKISEHGKGRAIDISGFTLEDGTKITVLKGWNQRRYSKALRQMHKGACGPFGTVLGPEADRFHRDHFHFDTARYRSGSYCR